MHIHLENFRNISSLDLDLTDGKTNYLFGVCGSGKSSIISAISNETKPEDTTVGKTGSETIVEITGLPEDPQDVRVYNATEQQAIFIKNGNTNVYDVFIGDEAELEELEQEFFAKVEDLQNYQDDIRVFQSKITELQTAMGKLNRGNFTAKSKVTKAATAAQGTTPFIRQAIEENGLKYTSWLAAGLLINDDFTNDVCPFCKAGINASRKGEMEALGDITVDDLKPLMDSSTLLEQLKINKELLGTTEGAEEVKDQLKELYKAADELNKIIGFCNTTKTSLMKQGLPSLSVDSCVYSVFPKLKPIVEELNNKAEEIAQLLGSMKSAFNSIIGQRCRILNSELKRLSIPYQFKVASASRDQHRIDYILKHVNSNSDNDMRNLLSTGEKNLIALLLFLARPDGDVLLIDDPASSFDDYRRTQIFDLIQAVGDKTLLVVSHDQAFIKRALLGDVRQDVGSIQALSNTASGISVVQVSQDDIVYLPDEIIKHINEATTYRRKAINFRLLCDLKRDSVGDAWGYSSMILHREPKDDIDEELKKKGKTESDILTFVNSFFDMNMPAIPPSYPNDSTDESLSDFERLIEVRENLESPQTEDEKIQKKMLNDLVHMNDAFAYCLNPYKFATWAPILSNLLI